MTKEHDPANKAAVQAADERRELGKQLADALADFDRMWLEIAANRCNLLSTWHTEAATGHLDPPPTLWEQFDQAERQAASSPGPLSNEARQALLRTAIGATNYAVQPSPKVAYLGPMYSYSYLAAARYFSTSAKLSPVATISAVFDEMLLKQADYGVVPIENSTDGRIVDTLTMFAKKPVRICGEVLLPIHHCLLGRGERSEIVEVYSKQQPFSQCRHWLSQHLPDAKLIETGSTTAAAKLASEKPNIAAIASMEAGMHYGLNVIQANIEDNPDNVTRFAILGQKSPAPTDNDKTSIMFQIPHRSGALAEAMMLFSRHNLNMTWIESFPIPGNSNEYLFFIEFEGHQDDRQVGSVLRLLSQQTLRLEILGSYPKGKASE